MLNNDKTIRKLSANVLPGNIKTKFAEGRKDHPIWQKMNFFG
jgi:hypothetical protein